MVKTRSLQELLGEHEPSLRNAVEWSYTDLDDCAQRLFERMSIFNGSFDVDAAREVCAFSPLRPGEAAAAFDDIIDKRLADILHGDDRERRFRMREATRTYARERLRARGEEALVHARHAKYFPSRA